MRIDTKYACKPFLKWVGGKSQLIPYLKQRLPEDFSRWEEAVYVEPFVGGGAMMFWILQSFPNIKSVYINDINSKLMTTYRVVKESPEQLLSVLEKMQEEYVDLREDGRRDYYLHKRELFNAQFLGDIDTASLLIFLNRTCFNGLYRENSKGEYNVPHGRYKNPTICDRQTIMADSALLQ